ncbi:hypothetical protein SAMN05216308_102161 [Nitrosospira sp. Nsp13]|jgi:hypothetical protein|nr:hypothetical protein SAMN05216308_102161 [Nitrosospira sp. Nsp13]
MFVTGNRPLLADGPMPRWQIYCPLHCGNSCGLSAARINEYQGEKGLITEVAIIRLGKISVSRILFEKSDATAKLTAASLRHSIW